MRYSRGITIRFNEPTVKDIESYLDGDAYYSKADFIRAAVREKIDRMKEA